MSVKVGVESHHPPRVTILVFAANPLVVLGFLLMLQDSASCRASACNGRVDNWKRLHTLGGKGMSASATSQPKGEGASTIWSPG